MRRMSLACRSALAATLLCTSALAATTAPDIRVVTVAGTSNADRRFEVFGLGADGHVYHRWQQGPGEPWSDWEELAAGHFNELHALRVGGRVYLAGLDQGELVVRAQAGPNGGFPGSALRAGTGLRGLAVATDAAGRIFVVAIGGEGELWTMHSLDAAPDPGADPWSAWEPLGGTGFERVALSRDGDGLLVVAAVGPAHQLYLAQQVTTDPASGWGEWPLTPAPAGQLQLVLGRDLRLWLLGIGEQGWLYGRSLARVSTQPIQSRRNRLRTVLPPHRVDPKSVRPANPVNPRTQVAPPPANPRSHVSLPLRDWGDWGVVSQQPFVALTALSGTTTRDGNGQLAGISTGTSVLVMTQDDAGRWPAAWEVLAGDARITTYQTIALATNAAGESRVFTTDLNSGKVFTLGRPADSSWAGRAWTGLGKIPGAAAPDLVFGSRLCFQFLDTTTVPQGTNADSLHRAWANTLRAAITEGVATRIAGAVRNTPLASLLANPNASARCTPDGEKIALWLDHEVWPGAFQEAPPFPDGALWVYQIPAATLLGIIDGQFTAATSHVTEIDITGHTTRLVAPDALQIDVDAAWKGLPFQATVTARLGLGAQGVPACTSHITATRPEGLYAILLTLAFPVVATPSLMQFGDQLEGEQLDAVAADVNVICRIADAILPSLFLPRTTHPDGSRDPLQLLVLPYDRLVVDPVLGIVGSGAGKPEIRAPHPTLATGGFAVGHLEAGTSTITMAFFGRTTEMNSPGLTYTWTPSDPAHALRLVDVLGFKGPHPDFAFFAYAVPPLRDAHTYDLGTMHLTVTNDDGQQVEADVPAVATTRCP